MHVKSTSFLPLILLAASIRAATIPLDLRAPATRLMSALPAETGVLRTTTLGAGAARASGLATGDVLALRLHDDLTLEIELTAREEAPLVGAAFQARVAGGRWCDATVLETPDGLQITATDPASGLVHTIASSPRGVTVREIDPLAEETTDAVAPVPAVRSGAALKASGGGSTDQSSTLVDVLVAYDTPSAAWADAYGGGLTNLAQQCVTRMNTALANNGLDAQFRFRLVGVTAVAADAQGNLNGTLKKVTNGTDAWAAVKALRDELGADVVSAMIDTGSAYGTTGVGWSLTDTDDLAAFAEHAYNVVAVRAAAQGHVMTHETGHNMGAGHSDLQADSPGPQSYSYSRGFYFTGEDDGVDYHTIMAYDNDGYGNHYAPAPLFSDRSTRWSGADAGDADHDNAEVLRNTFSAVSRFRAQKIATTYDVFFSVESGTVFEDSLEVALVPGKADLEIRYTTDGSTPTPSHGTVYTAPLAFTRTTTLRAATIRDGVAGPVYEATYYLADVGAALNAPQLTWDNSSDYPWEVESDDTYDGVLALRTPSLPKGPNNQSWLVTTVTGPTRLSFRYHNQMYDSSFSVYVGADQAWTTESETWDWTLVEVEIPAGEHVVTFEYDQGGYYGGDYFCGVCLDHVRLDALSRPPVLEPATTRDETTARVFTDTLTVTLVPGTAGGRILYTLDGTDPAGENGRTYTEPLTLTESTLVRATESDAGKNFSVEAAGLFLERHDLAAGEWTTDVDGARTAAAADGQLICVLLADYATDGWSASFASVAKSLTFLNWARANGVYLVTTDASLHPDTQASLDWFWTLFDSNGDTEDPTYPTMYFARADAPDETVAKGIARYDGSVIGTVPYEGTVATLVAGISSILTAQGFTPTAYTDPPVADVLETPNAIVWANTSTPAWREEYPNRMRAGGLGGDTAYVSVLTAQVSGKGRLVFTYEAVSHHSQNAFSYAVDGTQRFLRHYTGDDTSWRAVVTNEVTSDAGAAFSWTCTVGSPADDSASCGVWIHDVKWIPAGRGEVLRDDGEGNAIVIPEVWFAAYGLAAADATTAEFAAAADADADGDGTANWVEYVCGTDPNDPNERLACTLVFIDGEPQVDYVPKTGFLDGYRAVLMGRTSLNEGAWQERNAAHRFFKVVIEKAP